MHLLSLAALLIAATPVDDELRVLQDAQRPREMLQAYLMGEAGKAFDARRRTVAALKTPDAWNHRRDELRGKFLAALGAFPERTPLNARVVGRDRRDGYAVERVVFESRPGHHVTAVLYLPEAEPPLPGVLVPCGHSADGKAAEPYQRACILMAKNGMAVLCYDPIGQGERVQLLDDGARRRCRQHDRAHHGRHRRPARRPPAGPLSASGTASGRWTTWRPPGGRPERLGCTGNSGGGTMTAYLMALDDRIAAAAPSCYITSLERLFATIGPQDAEQNITGQVAFGMEHADYVTMRAPKPTLLCVGTRDYFDIDGAWASFREAKLAFGRFGHGERVELFESDEPHGFTRPRREAAMRWMRRWLLHRDDAPVEPVFPIATAETTPESHAAARSSESFRCEVRLRPQPERADELERQRAQQFAGRRPRHCGPRSAGGWRSRTAPASS
jgi:dienelactone hydrolase